jgi:hypothetical protein
VKFPKQNKCFTDLFTKKEKKREGTNTGKRKREKKGKLNEKSRRNKNARGKKREGLIKGKGK